MNNIPHNDVAIQTIQAWLSDIIIGHNFCPFAKREFERESIAYTVSRAVTLKNATDQLLTELHTLEQNSQIETSLLIFSTGFSDFDDYLDLVAMSQALIEGGGYAGQFQLASFHPDYCFEGEAPDDLSNYTNRAPLPILHDPENIPLRNIDKARQLGQMYWQQTLHRLNRPESKD